MVDTDVINTDAKTIVFKISNNKEVPLADLALCLNSLADQYTRFANENIEGELSKKNLYVKEIKSGSIIFELLAKAHQLDFLAADPSMILEFAKMLKVTWDYMLGKSDKKPDLSIKEYQNHANILNPVARDIGSQINVNVQAGGTAILNFGVDSIEANAIQNRIQNEIGLLKTPVRGIKEKQTFYWYQARNEANPTSGDKGIIESVSDRPAKVIFSNEKAKKEMLKDRLFAKAFIVDVDVHTINDIPATYKILQVHETFDRPQ